MLLLLNLAAVLSLTNVQVLSVHDDSRDLLSIASEDNAAEAAADVVRKKAVDAAAKAADMNSGAEYSDNAGLFRMEKVVGHGAKKTHLHLDGRTEGQQTVALVLVGVTLLIFGAVLFWLCCPCATKDRGSSRPKGTGLAKGFTRKLEDHDDDSDSSCFEFPAEGEDDSQEDAMVVPENAEQLEQLLKSEGIDTSEWKDSLAELQVELSSGACYLKHAQAPAQPKKLVREVRLLYVRLGAMFPTGLHTLMNCKRVAGESTTKFKNHKNIAKKIRVFDDVDDELPDLLHAKLLLPAEWQQKHLRLVHTRRTILEADGHEQGTSFPFLASRYSSEEMWLKLDDVNAEGVVGTLPCGPEAFQIKSVDGKAQWYEWTMAAELERRVFEAEYKPKGV